MTNEKPKKIVDTKELASTAKSFPVTQMVAEKIPDIQENKKDEKKENKKEEVKEVKNEDKKELPSSKPSLEELASRSSSEASNLTAANTTTNFSNTSSAIVTETEQSPSNSSNLDDIAASVARQQATQTQGVEYRIPGQQDVAGLRSLYQNPAQENDLANVYRPTNAQYTSTSQQQRESPQRGGIVHYENNVGREAADKSLDEKRRLIHGDKGLFEAYDRR